MNFFLEHRVISFAGDCSERTRSNLWTRPRLDTSALGRAALGYRHRTVDWVLPVTQMVRSGASTTSAWSNDYVSREVPPEGKDDDEVGLKELLNLVRIRTGCDLSHYQRHR